MLCLVVALFFVVTTQACPEPHTTVHIQNYDGPIIVHSSTCDHHCHPTNQNNQNSCYETDCTCVTRQNYPYSTTSSYPAINYGYGNQYCNTNELKAYPAVDNGYSCGNCNRCSNNNYQYQCAGYYTQ